MTFSWATTFQNHTPEKGQLLEGRGSEQETGLSVPRKGHAGHEGGAEPGPWIEAAEGRLHRAGQPGLSSYWRMHRHGQGTYCDTSEGRSAGNERARPGPWDTRWAHPPSHLGTEDPGLRKRPKGIACMDH